MKHHLTFLFILLLCPLLKATSESVTMIPQPANLVGDSVPGCIPLTSAVCFANYNYGIHKMISAPHPFIRGAKDWKRGTESNANLASVFGIRVKPTDDTSVPYAPVEIHLKDWEIPAYSPHTKEEVLAATIHCLLLSCRPGPGNPLDLRIIAENEKDLTWAKPFEKKYITRPGENNESITPTPVGNSFIKTDGFGIRYVISKKTNPKHLTPNINPAILPVTYGDRGDTEYILPALVPTWEGSDHALDYLSLPNGHFHNISTSGLKFTLESNAFLVGNQDFSLESQPADDVVEVNMMVFNQSLDDLSSGIAAAVMTTRINHDKPMKISVGSFATDSELIEALLETPGWVKSETGGLVEATATLDYDPKTKSLAKGTLPGGIIISTDPTGQIFLKKRGE